MTQRSTLYYVVLFSGWHPVRKLESEVIEYLSLKYLSYQLEWLSLWHIHDHLYTDPLFLDNQILSLTVATFPQHPLLRVTFGGAITWREPSVNTIMISMTVNVPAKLAI